MHRIEKRSTTPSAPPQGLRSWGHGGREMEDLDQRKRLAKVPREQCSSEGRMDASRRVRVGGAAHCGVQLHI